MLKGQSFNRLSGYINEPYVSLITNDTSHTDPLFKKSKILKIEDVFQYQAALFMCDYKYEKLPPSFRGTFKQNDEFPNSRTTRQSNLLCVPKYHSKFTSILKINASGMEIVKHLFET